MLCWISMIGGLLIMMGHQSSGEALFYYFRLEGHVPENHLLPLIDKHISFDFVRERLKESYSNTGRPSIDPDSDAHSAHGARKIVAIRHLSIGESQLPIQIAATL